MLRSAAYKFLVFTTALLCVLSFANAETFAQQNANEVTHYLSDGDFLCSRYATDDRADIPQNDFDLTFLRLHFGKISQQVLPALQQCYTLHDIRGPPAISSLI